MKYAFLAQCALFGAVSRFSIINQPVICILTILVNVVLLSMVEANAKNS